MAGKTSLGAHEVTVVLKSLGYFCALGLFEREVGIVELQHWKGGECFSADKMADPFIRPAECKRPFRGVGIWLFGHSYSSFTAFILKLAVFFAYCSFSVVSALGVVC